MEKYYALARHVIHEVYSSETNLTSMDTILEGISNVKVHDVLHLNLFAGTEVPEEDAYF